ncbi:MAG: hypothetical protein ABIF01_03345 [Candidatus Micrarchaeota archaeon]
MKLIGKDSRTTPKESGNAKVAELGHVIISNGLTLGEIYRSTGKNLPGGLGNVTIAEMNSALTKAERDPVAGISHALVKKDDKTGFGLHVASVETGVNPHVHKEGDEDYIILEGRGTMWLAKVAFDEEKKIVGEWKPNEVSEGMVLTVPGGYAHRLENANGQDKPIKIAFTCPDSHLREDRYATPKPPGSKK